MFVNAKRPVATGLIAETNTHKVRSQGVILGDTASLEYPKLGFVAQEIELKSS